MFDIGLFELVLVAVIGLLVLGPERLPEAIRTAALHIGRLKRMYRSVRNDIEKEIGADDIRRQLHNEEILQSLEQSRQQIDSIAGDINRNAINPLNQEMKVVNQAAHDLNNQVSHAGQPEDSTQASAEPAKKPNES